MELEAYLAAIERDASALAQAAEGRLDREVPTCPGWDLAELVWHTGEVHDFWRQIAKGPLLHPAEAKPTERPDGEELVSWFREGVVELTRVLAGLDPETRLWTWAPQKNGAFIPRRMAQETAVHSWDAHRASGSPSPIEPQLAADGIDEFLTVFLPASRARLIGDHSAHVHCTDVDGEWTIQVNEGDVEVTREHAKGAVALRGAASDLLLVLWRRLPADTVEVHGDPDNVQAFLALADLE